MIGRNTFDAISVAIDNLEKLESKFDVDAAAKMRALRDRLDTLQNSVGDRFKAELRPMGNGAELIGAAFKVKLVIGERTTIDADALRKDHPIIAATYSKTSPFEQLRFGAAG